MKQVRENIKTIPKNSIQINTKAILAVGNGIRVLLELFSGSDEYIPDLVLESPTKENIEEILETASYLDWVGKTKNLKLVGRAIQLLPALGLHEESKIEEITLRAYDPEHIAEIFSTENSSVSIGGVKRLFLHGHALQILPKLGIHGESVMVCLELSADRPEHIAEILREDNEIILMEKVRRLELRGYAIQILPKLGIHGESVMEGLILSAYFPEDITEILKERNNSIWVGRVKLLILGNYATQIFPKLRIHEDNVMEVLRLYVEHPEQLTGIFGLENNSICIGKMKRLELRKITQKILPKLRFHEENVMEELELDAYSPKHLTKVLKMNNNTILAGKVKKLNLRSYAIGILPKLRIHEKNVMDELELNADSSKQITEILKTENNSIWIGKVKNLKLRKHALKILSKLKFHEENVMKELVLCADNTRYITEILKMDNNSLWIGKVKNLKLRKHALKILPKLKFHEENVMKELNLKAGSSKQITDILKKENKASCWGR
ncbi:MAG: uncharacterized protein A8A55_1647 [Amphiamblys sp. WSBS2006]|nr:MAG: uncharacterized protein A8A55_1647 [Amphiamblys sp. WSBS2006]